MDHIGNRAVHDVDCYFYYYDYADGRYDAGVFVDDVNDCGFDVQLNYHDVVHYHHDDYGDTNDQNWDHETALPVDGLCDFIFYESFYLKLLPVGWTDPGLDHFLAVGKQMSVTGIGASFSPA
ncbi:uncharacterized protein LOC144102178 [Amblyomma americanum]